MIKPSQRIQIIESNKKCKPGSIGYFIKGAPVYGYNGWEAAAVFTRFGKKGKPRVDLVEFAMPVVDYNELDEESRGIVNIIKYAEQLEPRISISDVGRKYKRYTPETGGTKLKAINHEAKNLLEMDPLEFLAYVAATSITLYSSRISRDSLDIHKPYGVNISRFVNDGFPIGDVPSDVLGFYIVEGWKLDQKTKTDLCSNFFITYFSSSATRIPLCERMAKKSAILAPVMSQCEKRNERYHVELTDKISKLVMYYRKNKKELAQIAKIESDISPWKSFMAPRLERELEREVMSKKVKAGKGPIPSYAGKVYYSKAIKWIESENS